MAGEVELILGASCGLLIALAIATSYWFYTVPRRYAENVRKLDPLLRK